MQKHSSQNSKASKIALNEKDLQIVLAILRNSIPHATVWAFGSRATGSAKEHSDLDLAIVHAEPIDPGLLAKLRLAFEESDLPIKVDLVEFLSSSLQFQKIIESSKIEIQHGTATGI